MKEKHLLQRTFPDTTDGEPARKVLSNGVDNNFPEERQDGDFVNSRSEMRASCLPHQDLGMHVVMHVYVSPKFIRVDA